MTGNPAGICLRKCHLNKFLSHFLATCKFEITKNQINEGVYISVTSSHYLFFLLCIYNFCISVNQCIIRIRSHHVWQNHLRSLRIEREYCWEITRAFDTSQEALRKCWFRILHLDDSFLVFFWSVFLLGGFFDYPN